MLRFECPSVLIPLKVLRAHPQRLLVGLAVSLVLHASLTLWSSASQQERTVKPLTTKFVKRQPRLTKPLELKKRPQPKRRTVQRKMVSLRARARLQHPSRIARPDEMVQRLVRPSMMLGRPATFQSAQLEPEVWARSVLGAKEPKHQADLSLEMLDIEALDTGKYHAMVVQDPSDRQNLRGFLHIALVVPARSSYDASNHIRYMRRLAKRGMNRYTQIRTDILPPLTFDSREIFKVPWLFTTDITEAYMAGSMGDVTLTDNERRNPGSYLMQGGFVHADAIPPLKAAAYAPATRLRRLITDALERQGWDITETGGLRSCPTATRSTTASSISMARRWASVRSTAPIRWWPFWRA